jgi:hypothetical protein
VDGDLRPIFRGYLPRVDWQSIETAMTGGGVPDSNYCVLGFEGWIEYKKTKAWAVKVRTDQVGWIERRVRHGGRVLVAVRRVTANADQLYLYRGPAIRPLKSGGIQSVPDELLIGNWDGGPGKWDWDAVLEAMKT